jgi:hypothetical protein
VPGRSDGLLRGKSLGAITLQGMVKALLSCLRLIVIPMPIVDGSLCGGVSLNQSSGNISGNPT